MLSFFFHSSCRRCSNSEQVKNQHRHFRSETSIEFKTRGCLYRRRHDGIQLRLRRGTPSLPPALLANVGAVQLARGAEATGKKYTTILQIK